MFISIHDVSNRGDPRKCVVGLDRNPGRNGEPGLYIIERIAAEAD